MSYFIASSPHTRERRSTSQLMLLVILCTIPGVLALCYSFGYGVLFQILIATNTAILAEMLILKLRKRPSTRSLMDNSALLTGVLIGIAIPPLAPWWIAVIGTLFAIIVGKQLYGGLGQNPFNPAMVAYVVLLISFPLQMTSWLAPESLARESISFYDSALSIFTGLSYEGFSVQQLRLGIDGTTLATPLDQMKTSLSLGQATSEILEKPIYSAFAGLGWDLVNFGFLIGGIILLKLKAIRWHIPVAMLSSIFILSSIAYLISPEHSASPLLHLFSGATMFGAFFIATDPVTASTTIKGRLIFGAMIGGLTYLIRTFGGFPDGVAFAVLLSNMCVPLIDYYSKPKTYGRG